VLAIAAAGVAFMAIDGWAAPLAAMAVLFVGWSVAEMAFRRLADEATRRADLEERARNSNL
jgi:hypothetical protein